MSDEDRAQPARNEDADRGAADVARDAALQSLVSNAVYLAVMIGFTLAVTRRDWVTRQLARVQHRWSARHAAEDRAVAEFRTELSDLEHRGIR